MEISGRFRYAPKLYIDWLSERMPDAFVATKIPTDEVRGTDERGKLRPLVVIDTVPAGGFDGNGKVVLASRRLVFSCFAGDVESGESPEMIVGELAERVRALVRASRRAHVCRKASIVGEPARFDRPDEPVPRFQLTVDVLLREAYRHLTVVRD